MTQRDEARDGARGDRPDDRNHLKHPGQERQEQRERQLKDRQADERHSRHHPDEEHLPPDVPAEQGIDLREERNELVALARRKNSAEPLKEARGIPEEEEGGNEEDEKLQEQVPEAHDERDRAARNHLGEVADSSGVGNQRIQVFESDLVGGLGEGVLRVSHERWQRALQLTHLIDRKWDEKSCATNYGRKQPEEDDRCRHGPRKRETALKERDHRKEHIRQHAGPNKWAHDVPGAVNDVEGRERE